MLQKNNNLRIEQVDGYNYLRLDKLYTINGIKNYKAREFDEIMCDRYPNANVYGVMSSSYSESSLIVASLARYYNKKCVVYYIKKTPVIEKAEQLGAKTVKLPVTRLSIGAPMAKKMFYKEYTRWSAFIATGTANNEDIYEWTKQDAEEMKFVKDKIIHINIGSGLTAVSLLSGWVNHRPKKVIFYETGMRPEYNKYESILSLYNIQKIRMPWAYEDTVQFKDFNPIYDAKMVKMIYDRNVKDKDELITIIGSV